MRIIQSYTAEDETEADFDILLKHRGSFMNAIGINDAFFSVIDISWILVQLLCAIAIKVMNINVNNVGTLISFGVYRVCSGVP